MSGLDARIENLMNYAESRGGGDRTILFRNLIDLFLTSQAPVRQPMRRQLIALLSSLLKDVDPDTRRTAADLVAGIASPPLDLATALACDESADLVERLLLKTPFDEEALMIIINRTTKAHHQILASRTDLSANVWIALARAAPSARGSSLASGPKNQAIKGIDMSSGNVTPIDQSPKRRAFSGAGASHSGNGHSGNGHSGNGHSGNGHSGSGSKAPDFLSPKSQWHTSDPDRADLGLSSAKPALFFSVEDRKTETTDDSFDADKTENGWSFQSDRDGFITGLSSTGRALYSRTGTAKGAPLLDFLGLNAKLDHPIARAFQRRTALKESALFLSNLPKGKRHWVLSARPQFDPSSGVFLGYDCFLRPPSIRPAIIRPASSSSGASNPASDKNSDHGVCDQGDQAGQFNQLPPLCQTQDDGLVSRETGAQISKALDALDTLSEDISSEDLSPLQQEAQTIAPDLSEVLSSLDISSKVEKEVRRAVMAALREPIAPESGGLKEHKLQHNPSLNPEPADSARFVTQDCKAMIDDALDSLSRAFKALQDDELGQRKANRSLQWAIAGSALNAIKEAALPDDQV